MILNEQKLIIMFHSSGSIICAGEGYVGLVLQMDAVKYTQYFYIRNVIAVSIAGLIKLGVLALNIASYSYWNKNEYFNVKMNHAAC